MGDVLELPTGSERRRAQERIRAKQAAPKAQPAAANDPAATPSPLARAGKKFALGMAAFAVGAIAIPIAWLSRPAKALVRMAVVALLIFIAAQIFMGWPNPLTVLKCAAAILVLLAAPVAGRAGLRSLYALERRLKGGAYED
jgi:hypothetical protein